MKKILILIGCFFLLFSLYGFKSSAEEIEYIDLSSYIFDYQYVYNSKKIEVYGNCEDITAKQFIQIVENGNDKIYIHYNTGNIADLPYALSVIIKNNGKNIVFDYKVNEKLDNYKESIINYLNNNREEILSSLIEGKISTYSNTESIFFKSKAVYNATLDFPKYGYINVRVGVMEYKVEKSSLYLLTVMSSFVPGIVAVDNGLSGYNKWKNYSGYVHIKGEQAYDANEEAFYGKREGSKPYFKDFWPLNYPGSVTISSSLNGSKDIGVSASDGFYVGEQLGYSYSKAITTTEPMVSAQMSNDALTAMWSFKYDKLSSSSYHQEANYLYEMSNDGNDLFPGDVRFKIDYQFTVDRGGFYTKQTHDGNFDLIVRPLQLKIYNFCYGMI